MSYTATWNGVKIAEAPQSACQKVEGNIYFPPSALVGGITKSSTTTTVCGWKGTAQYYDIVTPDGNVNKDAVWYYADPKPAASNIKGFVAFWKGVTVN